MPWPTRSEDASWCARALLGRVVFFPASSSRGEARNARGERGAEPEGRARGRGHPEGPEGPRGATKHREACARQCGDARSPSSERLHAEPAKLTRTSNSALAGRTCPGRRTDAIGPRPRRSSPHSHHGSARSAPSAGRDADHAIDEPRTRQHPGRDGGATRGLGRAPVDSLGFSFDTPASRSLRRASARRGRLGDDGREARPWDDDSDSDFQSAASFDLDDSEDEARGGGRLTTTACTPDQPQAFADDDFTSRVDGFLLDEGYFGEDAYRGPPGAFAVASVKAAVADRIAEADLERAADTFADAAAADVARVCSPSAEIVRARHERPRGGGGRAQRRGHRGRRRRRLFKRGSNPSRTAGHRRAGAPLGSRGDASGAEGLDEGLKRRKDALSSFFGRRVRGTPSRSPLEGRV